MANPFNKYTARKAAEGGGQTGGPTPTTPKSSVPFKPLNAQRIHLN